MKESVKDGKAALSALMSSCSGALKDLKAAKTAAVTKAKAASKKRVGPGDQDRPLIKRPRSEEVPPLWAHGPSKAVAVETKSLIEVGQLDDTAKKEFLKVDTPWVVFLGIRVVEPYFV